MTTTVLELLESRVSGRGDLPVFRGSVLEVIRLGEDTQCAASDIARVILQDQGFAVKVLRIANSPYFNRSDRTIKTISRAVVLLGVEVIRDICLGLGFVEVFQRHHPWIDLRKILARSYFTAVLTRNFAERIPNTRKEELFLAGLLQYLGPLAVAYYLPEKYLEVQRVQQESGISRLEAERSVLGQPLSAFGDSLAERWSLPNGPPDSRVGNGNGNAGKKTGGDPVTIPALSREISENLFGDNPRCDRALSEILKDFEEDFQLEEEVANKVIQHAFTTSRNSSALYGLEPDTLVPRSESEMDAPDPIRVRILATLELAQKREELPSPADRPEAEKKDPGIHQLELLREISLHIFENRDLTTLFDLVMEGIQAIAGFDRIVLVLCNPNRTEITGRYGFGTRADQLARDLKIPFDPRNLFTRCLTERKPLLVQNATEEPYASLIPSDLRPVLSAQSFAVSPLYSSDRVVGLFYVDNANSKRPITLDEYQVFEHFAFQANLGLDGHRNKICPWLQEPASVQVRRVNWLSGRPNLKGPQTG